MYAGVMHPSPAVLLEHTGTCRPAHAFLPTQTCLCNNFLGRSSIPHGHPLARKCHKACGRRVPLPLRCKPETAETLVPNRATATLAPQVALKRVGDVFATPSQPRVTGVNHLPCRITSLPCGYPLARRWP